MYLDDCIHDAALRVWLEERPAYVVTYTPELQEQEIHLWHVATSSTSETLTSIHAWSGTITFFSDGAVSDTLKVTLQPNTHPAYRV